MLGEHLVTLGLVIAGSIVGGLAVYHHGGVYRHVRLLWAKRRLTRHKGTCKNCQTQRQSCGEASALRLEHAKWRGLKDRHR